ncbi:MAG: NADH-quinone oxidoreductase subunit N [Pirellulales bacterium]|nr:NADH-quinone oxidoreductase subunit N [Pirellulales bacterium]
MNFHLLLRSALDDTLGPTLAAFRPELALCATIVALLVVRMFLPRWRLGPPCVAAVGVIVALVLAAPWHYLSSVGMDRAVPIFTGMLTFDTFSVFLRSLLLLFVLLFVMFTQCSGVPREESATEFYVLVLGATVGMCLMVSANHMLVVFLGMEMASLPSYVLAGMMRHERRASEAALKYAVYGAGTAGVMLYGISLLVGALGSAHLPTMAGALADALAAGPLGDRAVVLMLGSLMIAVGLAFKLSAVPFHFWAPDVFEGATAEVAAFLSVASKAAALGLLVRLVVGLGGVADPAGLEALAPVRHYLGILIASLAAVTCTFGNLAAYGQTNLKRLLAYSTIAHAGYMMMPVAAMAFLMGRDPAGARAAAAAVVFYVSIYLFMNLGAFAVVAFVRNATGSEQIDHLAGLIRRSTGLAVCFAVMLFSLVGLPPLAGFAGKFAAFAAVYDAGLISLLVIGLVNTVLSLFYYLRVVKVMALAPESEEHPAAEIPLGSTPGVFCLALTVPLVVWGIWWNGLFTWAQAAAALLVP